MPRAEPVALTGPFSKAAPVPIQVQGGQRPWDFSLRRERVEVVEQHELLHRECPADTEWEHHIPMRYRTMYELEAVLPPGRENEHEVTWSSLKESVATITTLPGGTRRAQADWVSDGIATIRAQCGGVERRVGLAFERATVARMPGQQDAETAVPVSFVPGSLIHAADQQVQGWLDAHHDPDLAAARLPIFTTQNHSTGTYVRNPECWLWNTAEEGPARTARRLHLCAISPWNSTGAGCRAGTLITPRHVAMAAHFPISVGATIRFVGPDNTLCERQVTSRAALPGSSQYADIMIATLNADVPADIARPMKLLPSNWATKTALHLISTAARFTGVLFAYTDQHENACMVRGESGVFNDGVTAGWFGLWSASPYLPQEWQHYHRNVVEGDSGSPAMLLLPSGEVCLQCCWLYGGGYVGAAALIPACTAQINAITTQAGGGYTVAHPDLSSFPSYS